MDILRKRAAPVRRVLALQQHETLCGLPTSSATACVKGAAASDWSPRKLMAVTISAAAMGLGGRREFRGRATLGIDRADMAPDGLGNVCGMSQRAHMTGVGNLVIAGMG